MTVERRVRPYELVEGDFLDGVAKDSLGRIAQEFARNLREAMTGRSGRGFERESGMSNASVVRILKGQVWPDAVTIARLELSTGRSLWPAFKSSVDDARHEHRIAPQDLGAKEEEALPTEEIIG